MDGTSAGACNMYSVGNGGIVDVVGSVGRQCKKIKNSTSFRYLVGIVRCTWQERM